MICYYGSGPGGCLILLDARMVHGRRRKDHKPDWQSMLCCSHGWFTLGCPYFLGIMSFVSSKMRPVGIWPASCFAQSIYSIPGSGWRSFLQHLPEGFEAWESKSRFLVRAESRTPVFHLQRLWWAWAIWSLDWKHFLPLLEDYNTTFTLYFTDDWDSDQASKKVMKEYKYLPKQPVLLFPLCTRLNQFLLTEMVFYPSCLYMVVKTYSSNQAPFGDENQHRILNSLNRPYPRRVHGETGGFWHP